jgi:hypothetical protein
LRDLIRAELLIASSQRARGEDLKQTLQRAYSAIKASLTATNVKATRDLISLSVPVWVLEGAIELEWVSNPPPSVVPFRYAPVYSNGKWLQPGPLQPDLSVTSGAYDIPESFRAWFLASLEPAIAGWQGEELKRSATAFAKGEPPTTKRVDRVATTDRVHATGLSKIAAPAEAEQLQPDIDEAAKAESKLNQQKKRRGRPTVISDELKLQALSVQGGKARAKILYKTSYPTAQQVKNVSSLLRHFDQTRRKSE